MANWAKRRSEPSIEIEWLSIPASGLGHLSLKLKVRHGYGQDCCLVFASLTHRTLLQRSFVILKKV